MDRVDVARRTCPRCGTVQTALSSNEALRQWLIQGGGLTRHRSQCQSCCTGWGYATGYRVSELPGWRRTYFTLRSRARALRHARRINPMPIAYVSAVLLGIVVTALTAPWLRPWNLVVVVALPVLPFVPSFIGYERR